MPLLDRIVAIVVLSATLGVLAFRAYRMWVDFRIQRRAVELLVRSVTELERPTEERRP